MSPALRVVFAIGERLGMSAAAVDRMSAREVQGWIDYYAESGAAAGGAAPAPDDAIPLASMSKAALRAAFHK
jgi:hypothetical protein